MTTADTNRRQPSKVAQMFANHINTSRMTQRDIAAAAGYRKANIITMFKSGDTPIPIPKVPIFAKILGIDPKRFLRVALEEYNPEILETIGAIHGTLVSDNEFEIITRIRKATGDSDPAIKSQEQSDALEAFAKSLVQ